MSTVIPRRRFGRRERAAAAVELTLMLPVLSYLIVVGIDFGRIFYTYATITTCARNGALYASDVTTAANSPYSGYAAAALFDGSNLSPALVASNVSLTSGTDTYGSYVEVTVTYQFQMLSGLLGSSTQALTRAVRMRVAPSLPG